MSTPEAVFVSYRLGGTDGVSVEATKWEWALRRLGFTTRRVAGEIDGDPRPDDVRLPFLAVDPAPGTPADPAALADAIAAADLVVITNLCSLPINLEAASIARDVVVEHRGRVCFHHHDLAWERQHLAHIVGFPPQRADSLHVAISEHARAGLRAHGFDAVVVPNSFDFDAFDGDGPSTRAALGVDTRELLLVQPTRAIPRKNIAGGLRFAAQIAERMRDTPVRYWITGPAEDGYDDEFARLVATSPVPVHVGRARRSADAYAAADLVVFPSTWEGFGNPVVESVAARRMVAVGTYPVLSEITVGLDVLSVEDPDGAVAWLRRDAVERARVLDANYAVGRARFSIENLPERISQAFATVGWTDW